MTEELKDVTAIFDHYRVSAREIWNTAFWPDPEFREGFYIGQFEWIAKILFDTLVLAKLDVEFSDEDLFHKPIPFFHVIPNSTGAPIMIAVPHPPGTATYWGDPVTRIPQEGVELHFIEFFDWRQMAVLEFQYYKVRIERFDEHPHLAGRDALIEKQYVKVLFSEPRESSD
ncbi:MAG: hypothetical protein WB561_00765 [Terracidiphilus sp.]